MSGTLTPRRPDPLTYAWEALGTNVLVRITQPGALTAARALLAGELKLIDRVASRFRRDSELEQLNERAGRLTPISPQLYEALSVALRAARLSGGLLDPTVGRELIAAGYDRDRAELPVAGAQAGLPLAAAAGPGLRPAGAAQPAPRSSWRDVRLLEGCGRATAAALVPAGVRIDLGATAKALAADRAAAAIAAETGSGVLVCLGGDIATAGPAPADGWEILVTDSSRGRPDGPGQRVRIHAGALATSSTTTLRWSQDGRQMHHIIDPRTGAPAQSPWRTVSVTAGTCVDANTASTAAIILGAAAPYWLEERRLAARLVTGGGAVVTVGGWPEEQRC
ncbi:MAG TPA: FAD:protein FMN transferase [Solirubrobacteraceae bacterium]|nr:FAD:protein FMN transferase [Solirubrobacteraceae bacterium]